MTASVSQPAQVNAAAAHTPTENGNGKSSGNLASQDVGLIFVREYYTFLNKSPNRLHAFYSNDSLMVRGDEGETAETIRGQEEIKKKIEELGFDDCKVLVTQVDSQVSAGNGILVQVLGEMCNRDAPLQKFSQTFFLAPQPNGYYVLNDIFRFLKEEVNIDYYTCEEQEQKPAKKATASEAVPATNEASSELAELDSTAATTASTPIVEPAAPTENTANAAENAKEAEKKETEASAVETPAATKDTEAKAKSSEAPKPKAAKPEAPKTWANLAAGNDTNKWKSNATTTENKAQSAVEVAAAKSGTHSKSSQSQTVAPSHTSPKEKEKEKEQAQRKEEATEVFLKNTKGLTVEQIKEVLTAEIGEVKSVTLNPYKPTGFLEFASPESCQKALAQHKVKVGENLVLVEERRPPKYGRQQINGSGGPFERRFQGSHHRRGGGAPRGGGSKSRGGGTQKSG